MRFNSHYRGQELICHHQQPSQWFATAVYVCGLMDSARAHTHTQTHKSYICLRWCLIFECVMNRSALRLRQ